MSRRLFFIVLILQALITAGTKDAKAQDSLLLQLNARAFDAGDTIRINCMVPAWENTRRLGTVNLLIEDVQRNNMWRLRYPVVEGYYQAELVLPPDMPSNRYVITASLQPSFFQLTGRWTNRDREDSVRYTLQLEDKSMIAGVLPVNEEGAFRMPRHVFSGRAVLFFSPKKLTRGRNEIDVRISTPLDSSYTAIAKATADFTVGNVPEQSTFITYAADSNLVENQGTLQQVIVKGKGKTKAEQYDQEVSSGYFKGDRTQVFSGLDGEFSGFFSILDYLGGRVAGLNIQKNTEEFAQYLVTWRNEPTAFFIDEVPVDVDAIYAFPPSEIALVKVFPPPFQGMIFGAGGGAIALYSKKAGTGQLRNRNRFVIQGFSAGSTLLKVLPPARSAP